MNGVQVAVFFGCLLASFVVSLIVTPVVVLLRKQFYVPFIRKKLLQKAISEGHIVQAVLMDEYATIDPNNSLSDFASSSYMTGVYQYEYDGKKYKYRANTRNTFPKQMEFYFIKNPAKAGDADEIGLRETSFNVLCGIYFSSVLVIAVILYFVVMQFVKL